MIWHETDPETISASVGLIIHDLLPRIVVTFSENEVALRTREGHILSFGLNSNLTTTLLDNSSLVSYNIPAYEDREQISALIGS